MKRQVSILLLLVMALPLLLSLVACQNNYNEEETTMRETVKEIIMEGEDRLLSAKLTDGLFAADQKLVIATALKYALEKLETRGSFQNIINAANKNAGREWEKVFVSASFEDFETFKLMETMMYVVAFDAEGDEELVAAQAFFREKLDYYIPFFAEMVEESGYISSYFTLYDVHWIDYHAHELFNCGQYYEMAMALYRTTNGEDTRLLDCAVRSADYLTTLFGKGKWNGVPGHQEIEQALVRLAEFCREIGGAYGEKADSYVELAEFFLDNRGNYYKRKMPWKALQIGDTTLYEAFKGEYNQDHAPAYEQTEAYGHAVRATLMYTGMAAAAAYSRDGKYDNAILSLWEDVQKKSYPTGGVGSNPKNEGFDATLTPTTAYCETCASVGMMRWAHEMSEYYGDASYMDGFERVLYNAFLSGMGLDGQSFFYVNPVVSDGSKQRAEWFDCSCCPPNILCFLMLIQDYLYRVDERGVQVDLYISNTTDFCLDGKKMNLAMDSTVIEDGTCRVTISGGSASFALRLRKPYWATEAVVKVNGETVTCATDEDGYLVLSRDFRHGDVVELSFGNELQLVACTDTANAGSAYLQKGPIVYVAENADSDGLYAVIRLSLDRDAALTFSMPKTEKFSRKLSAGGMNALSYLDVSGFTMTRSSTSQTVTVRMIPYYAFANRGETAMQLYFPLS